MNQELTIACYTLCLVCVVYFIALHSNSIIVAELQDKVINSTTQINSFYNFCEMTPLRIIVILTVGISVKEALQVIYMFPVMENYIH